MYRFCLDTCIEQIGDYNAGTARHYANLGKSYRQMEQNTLAEEMLLKSLQIKQAILGPGQWHSHVATSHNYPAVLYMANLCEYEKAEKHFLLCIKIRLDLFGPAYSQHQYRYNVQWSNQAL